MKPSRGLPDPKASLSASSPSQAIAEANKEVEKAMQATKRGPYLQFNPSLRCEIIKYADHHGATAAAAAAARHYLKKLEKRMCESTVKSIKVYVEELWKRPRTLASSNVKISPVLNFRPCLIFVGRLGRRKLNRGKIFTYEILLIRKFPIYCL